MNARIREQFGFSPPDEFGLFWEFARQTDAKSPHYAFHRAVPLSLAGPFDVLAGRFDAETANYDPESADDEATIEHQAICHQLLESLESFCSRHKLATETSETLDLRLIDDCDPPPPFPFPEPADFDKLPGLIDSGIQRLTADGFSEVDAQLRIGRLLWHWQPS